MGSEVTMSDNVIKCRSTGIFRGPRMRLHAGALTRRMMAMLLVGAAAGCVAPRYENPVGAGESPDPFVCWDAETASYYLLFTCGKNVSVFRSKTLAGLRDGERRVIYEPRDEDGIFGAIWAPEMHKAPNGKWYVYTSGLLRKGNPWGPKRLFVLESKTADPFDGFVCKGKPAPNLFAIDPTVMTWKDGKQYVCYSEVKAGVGQVLVIREMENPWTFGRREAEVAHAELAWELKDQKINEGAFFIRSPDDKRLFIIYSGNGCFCDDYALGCLEFMGGDLCDAKNWKKHPTPLLVKANGAFGPGHASFFRSPDGKELWCAYHAMRESNPNRRQTTRWLNFQKVEFDATGYPVMGVCNGRGPHAAPSGESSPVSAVGGSLQ